VNGTLVLTRASSVFAVNYVLLGAFIGWYVGSFARTYERNE
jgi:hypothetical protein